MCVLPCTEGVAGFQAMATRCFLGITGLSVGANEPDTSFRLPTSPVLPILAVYAPARVDGRNASHHPRGQHVAPPRILSVPDASLFPCLSYRGTLNGRQCVDSVVRNAVLLNPRDVGARCTHLKPGLHSVLGRYVRSSRSPWPGRFRLPLGT